MITTTFVLLPLYMTLSSNFSYAPLSRTLAAHPSLTVVGIVNPDNGPGATAYPDADTISAISSLNAHANFRPVCYVHTAYATRAVGAVEADIRTCAGWAAYPGSGGVDIHMGGVFFDEAPETYSADAAAYMQHVAAVARSALGAGNDTVIFNPGLAVDARFYAIADYVNVFESGYGAYGRQDPLAATPAELRNRSSVMVYGVRGKHGAGVGKTRDLVDEVVGGGFAGLFVSTSGVKHVYERWSWLWDEFNQDMVDANAA